MAPEVLLDIGANYGVASLFMKHAMPDTPLIAVEANTELIPFIERNLQSNNKDGFSIINAIAGETPSKSSSFSINKRGTQASRVMEPLSNGEPRMPVGGVVVFDDTKLMKGEYQGKGELAVPYLLENGFELITRGRATVALERMR